jgi:hypothetical protein
MPANPDTSSRAWAAISQAPLVGLRIVSPAEDNWAQWANAVCSMSLGDYSRAFLILQPLAREVTPTADLTIAGSVEQPTELVGLAATALASGLRQLNEHHRALLLDRAVATAPGAAGVDSIIGTAADHVGLGNAVAAADTLAMAQSRLATWRDRVRFHWVAAEIDLLRGEPAAAADQAAQAVAYARDQDSPRHRLKSELFLAVAREVRRTGDGEQLLHSVVAHTADLQLRPLLWPAVEVLADRATVGERSEGVAALDFITARLPHGVGARWSGTLLRRSWREGVIQKGRVGH